MVYFIKEDKPDKWKAIGILGGMGPEATSDLYLKIIRIFQTRYGARDDTDYPKMFVYNLPLPDIVQKASNVQPILESALETLRQAGSDFVVIPCNTADCILKAKESENKVPIISIVEETARFVKLRKYRKVGLLSTLLTVKTGVYSKALNESGVQLINSNKSEQEILTQIILNILGGNKNSGDVASMGDIIRRMARDGAEAVILGCTELPLLMTKGTACVELIDTISILAEAAVREARGESNVA